ncbi:carboxypeptidase M32 [Clostridium sardiniense]|uniref:Metal-dependent carboxypeptidase n=1 Tax=Clostridium sardiniense TaxID=29369 RepID=A0ABS7L236_CLOSR|nr:carboxypeptidase M32 [Clostridium sardiniense]MBY0757141.1 carboxypeptidase M32 [Clostridium sardiniense]MDQ0461401.1 carboxypeptidase Taq [Clostridium sardiniense]
MRKTKLNELKSYIESISKMNSALELIYWDMQTKMPKKAIEQRSGIIEHISGEIFRMTTSDRMGELLDYFVHNIEGLSEKDKAIIKHARKEYDETKKIPEERYREFVIAQALSEGAWEEAKEKKDFEIFKPHLKRMIDFQREFVEYWGYKDNKYDTLLDKYEEGLTVKKLDKIFDELKNGIIKILNKIEKSGKQVNRDFLLGRFDKNSQEKFALFILNKMGYDLKAGRLDESMHPFTISFGNKDVRITTNYDNEDFTSALFSSIHEGGHGIFDQDVPDDLQRTGLDTSLSMSIHESQSRFYENILGRSKEFWEYFFPFAKYEFSEFKDISLEEFYEAINYVEPSLIRTEADELTYSIHIIIRYEIEKALINGDLDIDDVKEVWNRKYKDYLGVEPKNDSEGILQDIHWSDGSFGYFPSYALGNIYGAQMLHTMKKEYQGIYDDIRNGELGGIHMWLYENVHKYGAMYSPSEIIKNISNEDLSCKYFLDYLEKKYLSIYK